MYAAKFKSEETARAFYTMIQGIGLISRFRFIVEMFVKGNKQIVKFQNVRLKESKPYCGNHAGPCQLSGHKPDRKGSYLEGVDWVAFNDMVNDVLDLMNADCAVSSSTCVIRIGGMRCVEYVSTNPGQFDNVGYYEDCRGQRPPRTKYPKGTPGIDTWRA